MTYARTESYSILGEITDKELKRSDTSAKKANP